MNSSPSQSGQNCQCGFAHPLSLDFFLPLPTPTVSSKIVFYEAFSWEGGHGWVWKDPPTPTAALEMVWLQFPLALLCNIYFPSLGFPLLGCELELSTPAGGSAQHRLELQQRLWKAPAGVNGPHQLQSVWCRGGTHISQMLPIPFPPGFLFATSLLSCLQEAEMKSLFICCLNPSSLICSPQQGRPPCGVSKGWEGVWIEHLELAWSYSLGPRCNPRLHQ